LRAKPEHASPEPQHSPQNAVAAGV
jgi:hypothetical protein